MLHPIRTFAGALAIALSVAASDGSTTLPERGSSYLAGGCLGCWYISQSGDPDFPYLLDIGSPLPGLGQDKIIDVRQACGPQTNWYWCDWYADEWYSWSLCSELYACPMFAQCDTGGPWSRVRLMHS
jgi:hypothetical protein